MAQLNLFGELQKEILQEQSKVITKEVEKKLYHSITEVANMFNVNASLLRFWEKEFTQLKPRKTGHGDRLYNKENIHLIGAIYYLTKQKRFTLEGTREYLKNAKKAANTESDLVTQLQNIKIFLQDLKAAFKN